MLCRFLFDLNWSGLQGCASAQPFQRTYALRARPEAIARCWPREGLHVPAAATRRSEAHPSLTQRKEALPRYAHRHTRRVRARTHTHIFMAAYPTQAQAEAKQKQLSDNSMKMTPRKDSDSHAHSMTSFDA